MPRFALRSLLTATCASFIVGCSDEHPASPETPDTRIAAAPAGYSVATLPDHLVIEDEPMLAIARAVPTFAGFYYNDEGRVEVLMTEPSQFASAEPLVRARLSRASDQQNLRIRAASYTFMELARYRTVIRQTIFDIPGVVSLGVRESVNRVKVGVESPRAGTVVRRLIGDLGIPQDAVILVPESVGQDFRRPSRPGPIATSVTLQDQQPSGLLQGGWEIRNSAGGACTLGFPALRYPDHLPVFVTNSHCTVIRTSLDGSVFRQPFGVQVGVEIVDPPAFLCGFGKDCRHSDAAMVEAIATIDFGRIAKTIEASPIGCEHCVESLQVDPSDPTFEISSRNDNVFENEVLNKVGRTSGWTRGAVEDTCDDYESGIPGSGDTWVKQCSDRVDFALDPGDSGSPVFSVLPDGSVELRGLAFAEQPCCLGYYDAWMSDLNQIEKDLGRLVVHDPGPPSASILGPQEVRPNVWCNWEADVSNGVPPYSYAWSGLFAGSGSGIEGFVGSSGGWLFVQVTDGFGRQSTDAIAVEVQGEPGPIVCDWN